MTDREVVPLISASYDCMPSQDAAVRASMEYCRQNIKAGKDPIYLFKRFPGSPVKQELPVAGVRIVDLSTYQLAAHNIEHYVVGNDNIRRGGERLCEFLGNKSQVFVHEGPISGLSRGNTYFRAYQRIGPGTGKMTVDHPADTFLSRIRKTLENPSLRKYDIYWPLNSKQTNGHNVDRNYHIKVKIDDSYYDTKEGNRTCVVFDIIAQHPLGFGVINQFYGARKSFGRKILDIPKMLVNVTLRERNGELSLKRAKDLYHAFGEEGRRAVRDWAATLFKSTFTIPVENLEAILAHGAGIPPKKVKFDLSYDPGDMADVDESLDLIKHHVLALRHPDVIEGLDVLQRFSRENWQYLHMPEAIDFLRWHLKTFQVPVTVTDTGDLPDAEKFLGKEGLDKIDRFADQLRAFRDEQEKPETRCA